MNSMIKKLQMMMIKKITEESELYELFKSVGVYFFLNNLCGLFYSTFMIFFWVIIFVFRFFYQY
jgi:hypothetical protein